MRLPRWRAACRHPSSAATTSCSCSSGHSSDDQREPLPPRGVLGPAGIGKSRLATELLSWVDHRAVTWVGRCLSYGEGITFWPLAEALRGLGEPSLREALSDDDQRDTVLELLDGVTGASETVSSEQIFWAVRRAFEALARRRPLVLCFEDLHWAEPTMLDLIEYIVGWIQ